MTPSSPFAPGPSSPRGPRKLTKNEQAAAYFAVSIASWLYLWCNAFRPTLAVFVGAFIVGSLVWAVLHRRDGT